MRALQKYQKKIQKASEPIKKTFNIVNMVKAIYLLDKYYLSIRTATDCVTYNYQEIISNPCFLLLVFSSLKKTKSGGVDQIPVENVTLGGILVLSKALNSDTYRPKPSK